VQEADVSTSREDRRKLAEELLDRRASARAARDFPRADAVRDEIAALGFSVVDGPGGATLVELPPFGRTDAARLPDRLDDPATLDAAVHVLYEGHRSDIWRFLEGMGRYGGPFEVVVVDNASDDGDWLERLAVGRVRVLHLGREVGWAEARNAAMRTSTARVLVVADLSVVPRGDILTPLVGALDDPGVGVCGPWGLTTADGREFTESPGPAVHAIEGYLMAFRRETFARAAFDPWFAWYRHADLDLSFRIRALGLRALVVPVAAERREHRGWAAAPEAERAARSKRNFYRFLDHWRDRPELLELPE
jgi:Glycosyl transferase family 2